jgi:hypothetical protein
MQAPKGQAKSRPVEGRATNGFSERQGRAGLIASATSPTVDDYVTTGVSGQENVLFLF